MKRTILVVGLLLFIAGGVRLYGFTNPIGDWHSWRQADTSAVTRNFVSDTFNPTLPRYDDISNIQSGKDNPNGYRMVEFPIYNTAAFALISIDIQHLLSLEEWQRMVSIIFSLGTVLLLYFLGSSYGSRRIGIFAAATFAFLPFSIYYSRVILPEPALLFFTTGLIYVYGKWSKSKHSSWLIQLTYLFIAFVFGACALLIKPIAVFFWLPVPLIWFSNRRVTKQSILLFILSVFCIIIPFILWRIWINQFQEGIPAWSWLLNSDDIRFKGAFFHWIFAERISKLILGYTGVIFLILGILTKHKYWWIFAAWGFGALLYLIIFATGNVKHDYYQVILLPIISLYVAFGIDYLLNQSGKSLIPVLTQTIIILLILSSLAFSWYHVRGYYWINKPAIVEAGEQIDKLIPKDALVIAPYGGDTAFLYQTKRKGWPIGFEIEDKIKKGATYYVTVNPQDGEALDLESRYTLLIKTDNYSIISLQ